MYGTIHFCFFIAFCINFGLNNITRKQKEVAQLDSSDFWTKYRRALLGYTTR